MVISRGFVMASIGRRTVAWLIDCVGIVIVALVLAFALDSIQAATVTAIGADGAPVTTTWLVVSAEAQNLLLAIVSLVYTVPMWRLAAGTASQLALGLRVYSDAQQRPLSWSSALKRWMLLYGWILAGAVPADAVVGELVAIAWLVWLITLLVSSARSQISQGLHDLVARSVVVKEVTAFAVAIPAAEAPLPPR